MAPRIDRVYFQERQYLRSFDLTAEQVYHMEMRRRLNLALHLHGIVSGLDLQLGVVVPGGPAELFITAGVAIDAFGREIVLSKPLPLRDDEFRRQGVTAPGQYLVSIAYKRQLSTPPAPGFRLCDQPEQFTRWNESYEVLLTAAMPARAPAPEITDALSDDPALDPWPVVLGKFHLDGGGVVDLVMTDLNSGRDDYVGIRAQRLVAPVANSSVTLPIAVHQADFLVEDNLAIGTGFPVPGAFTPPPPAPFPKPKGNLKVDGDVFLAGDLYKDLGGNQWVGLKDFIRQFVPDVQMKQVTVPTAANSPGVQPSTGTILVPFSTPLNVIGSKDLQISIVGWTHLHLTNLTSWMTAVAGAGGATEPVRTAVAVQSVTTTPNAGGGNTVDYVVQWTVGPTAPTAPQLHVTELQLVCLAVFAP